MSKENGAVIGSWRELARSKGAHIWLIDSPNLSFRGKLKGRCLGCDSVRKFAKGIGGLEGNRIPLRISRAN